jgi:N-acetylated-alpha-linked acidic dipeptidase
MEMKPPLFKLPLPRRESHIKEKSKFLLVFAVILSLFLASGILFCVSTLLWYPLMHWNTHRLSMLDLILLLLSVPSAQYIRESSVYYTSTPHFPGQGLKQAQWTQNKWKDYGISDSQIVSYDVQLPAPTEHQRLALIRGSEVLYEAPLNDSENGFYPAFYSFVTNATISAPYIFANFGADDDYEDLVKNNVSLEGKIAVLKSADASSYLQSLHLEKSREVQIKNAQNRGLLGVVMYPDPQNDEPINEGNGYRPYPDGPARPPQMIERGGIGPWGMLASPFQPINID